jgi:hypothetical protein
MKDSDLKQMESGKITTGHFVAGSPNRPNSEWLTLNEILALLTCIALIVILGWICRYRMNPDAVHYLRLASYYVSGRPGLAVSGHWSPLISCLMAPLLGMGIDPLVTARIVTGLSALLFWFGALFLLKRLGLTTLAVGLAAWCLSFACASWSVAAISPDLLVAGLICFAVKATLADDWISNWKRQCLVGGLWALAYYGKAVALPLCILTCVGLAAWRVVLGHGSRAAGIRAIALTFAVCAALTVPWVTLLSCKYHRFTISTASRAVRVEFGPQKILGPQRVRSLDLPTTPEPGRISVYESFDYPTIWSPFESVGNAKHQLRLLFNSGIAIENHFRTFDIFSIGFISLFVVMILVPFERTLFRDKKWGWSLVPVLSLAAIYSPIDCYSQRYLWVLFPFFLALAFGLAELVVEKVGVSRISKCAIFALIALSFMLPPLGNCEAIIRHRVGEKGVFCYREMARRLKENQLQGPIAGNSESNPCSALYVAYFLNQPWLNLQGHLSDTTPITIEQFLNSKAKIIIANRNEPEAKELASDSHFRDLDQTLFGDSQAAAQSELKAFELLH